LLLLNFILKEHGYSQTRHDILPQTYMQFLYDKMSDHPRYRQTLLTVCKRDHIERDEFIYAPFNLFIGPDGSFRCDDPKEGIEAHRPQHFSEANWEVLEQIGQTLSKWSNFTVYGGMTEKEFRKAENSVISKCAHLLQKITNQDRDVIHQTVEDDWAMKQGKLYLR
jgi:hypothetical protein